MTKNHYILKVIALFLFLTTGIFLFIHFSWYNYFIHKKLALELIRSFHPYDEFVFILLQILQVVFAPIPGEATGLIGGFLYGPFLGTLYSTIGLTLGSWIAFYLSRSLGLPFVERLIKPEAVRKYDYVMEHKGALIAFILFLIPGFPKDYLCYLMGLSHMTTLTFLVISTTGRLFGTILLSFCGNYARQNQYVALFIVFGISGALILIGYLHRDKIEEMLKRKKQ